MNNKNKKGFTMIELAVVLAIMAIMTAAITPKYASYKKEKSMSYAKTQLVNDVRYVQNYTLSTKKFPDGSSPTGGFGVRFQTGSSYIIFGDKLHAGVLDHRYNTGILPSNPEYEFFETVELVNGITIQSLELVKSGVSTWPSSVDYVSVPPYGKVYIDGTQSDVVLKITFSNGVAGRTETILLNSSGFIS